MQLLLRYFIGNERAHTLTDAGGRAHGKSNVGRSIPLTQEKRGGGNIIIIKYLAV